MLTQLRAMFPTLFSLKGNEASDGIVLRKGSHRPVRIFSVHKLDLLLQSTRIGSNVISRLCCCKWTYTLH